MEERRNACFDVESSRIVGVEVRNVGIVFELKVLMLEEIFLAYVDVEESIKVGVEIRGVGAEILIVEGVLCAEVKISESVITGKDVRKDGSVEVRSFDVDGSDKRNKELVGTLMEDAEIGVCIVCS